MSVVSEIQRLQQAKSDIKAALAAKEVIVPNNAKLDSYPDYIEGVYSNLVKIKVSGSGSSIGAFDASIEEVILPDNTTALDATFENFFFIKKVHLPEGLQTIGQLSFYSCENLESIVIPSTVENISSDAFTGCSSLTSVTLDSNILVSGSYNLESNLHHIFGNQVREYIIGENVTSIGISAFRDATGIERVMIGNSITTINSTAFAGCSSLTDVSIGSGITLIVDNAFWNCRSLNSFLIKASTPPQIGTNAFRNVTGFRIYVPAESVEAYKTASNWSAFASYIEAIST